MIYVVHIMVFFIIGRKKRNVEVFMLLFHNNNFIALYMYNRVRQLAVKFVILSRVRNLVVKLKTTNKIRKLIVLRTNGNLFIII